MKKLGRSYERLETLNLFSRLQQRAGFTIHDAQSKKAFLEQIEAGLNQGLQSESTLHGIRAQMLFLFSNDCPFDIYQCEHPGSRSFTVGLVGPFTLTDGTRIPGQPNTMLDEHAAVSDVSQLDHDGINSCTAVCQQTYSCAGNSLSPSFRITRSFTKGTLNGQAVTNVAVTKEPM